MPKTKNVVDQLRAIAWVRAFQVIVGKKSLYELDQYVASLHGYALTGSNPRRFERWGRGVLPNFLRRRSRRGKGRSQDIAARDFEEERMLSLFHTDVPMHPMWDLCDRAVSDLALLDQHVQVARSFVETLDGEFEVFQGLPPRVEVILAVAQAFDLLVEEERPLVYWGKEVGANEEEVDRWEPSQLLAVMDRFAVAIAMLRYAEVVMDHDLILVALAVVDAMLPAMDDGLRLNKGELRFSAYIRSAFFPNNFRPWPQPTIAFLTPARSGAMFDIHFLSHYDELNRSKEYADHLAAKFAHPIQHLRYRLVGYQGRVRKNR